MQYRPTTIQRSTCVKLLRAPKAIASGPAPKSTAARLRAQEGGWSNPSKTTYKVFVIRSEPSIHWLERSTRYGTEAHMKITPAAARLATPISALNVPQNPD